MAQFRMLKGVSAALPAVSANTEGTIFYTYDDSLFHLDYKNENNELVRKTLNAEQAKSLLNARTITLTGDVSGSVSFDGSQNVDIQTTISNDFVIKEDLNALKIILTDAIDIKADKAEHNIKTYNSLTQLGLTNENMSITNFANNISIINEALNDKDSILYLTTTKEDNLHLSLISKLYAENNIKSIYDAQINASFIAVDEYNQIIYSTDGINWQQNGTIPEFIPSASFIYANNKFVATSAMNNDIAAYSEDGVNWVQTSMPAKGYWYSIAYGNGKFVTTNRGGGTDMVAYSEDGINWRLGKLPISHAWQAIAYGNGKFVAVTFGDAIAAYSEDGVNWTQITLPRKGNWQAITYGKDKFVIVPFGGNYALYSIDGITWTEVALPVSSNCFSIAYGNDKFVTIEYNYGEGNSALYSEDGITWHQVTLPISAIWRSVVYGNNRFIVIADASNSALYSEDGITWQQIDLPINSYWNPAFFGELTTLIPTDIAISYKISRVGDNTKALTIEIICNSDIDAMNVYTSNYYNGLVGKFITIQNEVYKEIIAGADEALEDLLTMGIVNAARQENTIFIDGNNTIFSF